MRYFILVAFLASLIPLPSANAQEWTNLPREQATTTWGKWLDALSEKCIEHAKEAGKKGFKVKLICECKAEEYINGEDALVIYDKFGLDYRDALLKRLIKNWEETINPGKAARLSIAKQVALSLNITIDRVCEGKVEELIRTREPRY